MIRTIKEIIKSRVLLFRPVHALKAAVRWLIRPIRRLQARSRLLFALRRARHSRQAPRTPRQVVILCDHVFTRTIKLGHSLRRAGWNVVLLHARPLAKGEGAFFDEIVRYRDPIDALSMAGRYHPVAYHILVHGSDYALSEILLKGRPGKIVLDHADILAGNYVREETERHYPGLFDQERRCLEQADGLVCRDLQLQYAKRELGFQLPKRILLLDGCWADGSSAARRRPPPGEIHVASAGIVGPRSKILPDKIGDIFPLVEAMTRAGIHFHLYLPPYAWPGFTADAYQDYLELERGCPFMHFHGSLPPEELDRALGAHTFGMHVVGAELHLPDDNTVLHRRQGDSVVARRFFNYLDAGLPMITHDGRLQKWLLRHYGIGLVAEPAMLTSPREWFTRILPDAGMDERIRLAQQALSIHKQVPRLIAFYERL